MSDLSTIQIRKDTREEIKQFGTKGETYEQILSKMVELSRKQLFFERQKQILKTEEFVPLDKI